MVYNFSASESFDSTYQTNVVVTSSGLCTYIPPGMFKSSCPIDITWFPFDDQDCDMKFGSWTYDGFKVSLEAQHLHHVYLINMFKVDLKLKAEAGDLGTYTNNGEWDLLSEPKIFSKYL